MSFCRAMVGVIFGFCLVFGSDQIDKVSRQFEIECESTRQEKNNWRKCDTKFSSFQLPANAFLHCQIVWRHFWAIFSVISFKFLQQFIIYLNERTSLIVIYIFILLICVNLQIFFCNFYDFWYRIICKFKILIKCFFLWVGFVISCFVCKLASTPRNDNLLRKNAFSQLLLKISIVISNNRPR